MIGPERDLVRAGPLNPTMIRAPEGVLFLPEPVRVMSGGFNTARDAVRVG
jgi:hypothetical protein